MKPRFETADDLLRAARSEAEPARGEGERVFERVAACLVPAPPQSAAPRTAALPLLDASARAHVATRAAVRSASTATRAMRLTLAAAGVFTAGFLLGRASEQIPPPPPLPHRLPSSDAPAPPVAPAPVPSASGPLMPPESGETESARHASPAADVAEPDAGAPAAARQPRRPLARSPASLQHGKDGPRAPRTAPRQPLPRASPSDDGAHDRDVLAQALAYVRRAQRSLRDGEPERALAALDDLDRQVPTPVLAEERAMTRVLALCANGDAPAAREHARHLLAEHPQSVYVTRLEASCVPDAAATTPEKNRRER